MSDTAQLLGITNLMKTGNIVFDMMLAVCIPTILRVIFNYLDTLKNAFGNFNWNQWWEKRQHVNWRYISHSTLTSYTGDISNLGSDSQNETLIKAIQLYLNDRGILKLEKANLHLTSFSAEDDDSNEYYYDKYGNYVPKTSKSYADTLGEYKVTHKPISNEWIDIGSFPSEINGKKCFKIEYMIDENEKEVDGEKGQDKKAATKNNTTLCFRSQGKGSIDHFITTAYQWYVQELRKLEDNSRYYYELKLPESFDSDREQVYKRYKLSEEKSFDSLFFSEKKSLLKSVDHFTKRTGKYAVKGYPHKFGLLLHGPPGTGKTSLIKALAQYTGRSIINVPLSKIGTNSELMSIFFDQKYSVDGEQVPIKLDFKDVIFVMEDVDAASKVVRRRGGSNYNSTPNDNTNLELPRPKSIWRMLLESSDVTCRDLVVKLMEKSERLRNASINSDVVCSISQRMGNVPGLCVIGEGDDDNDVKSKIAQESIEYAEKLMNSYRTIDSFISTHAQSLMALIESGAEVDKMLEDTLLGEPSFEGHKQTYNRSPYQVDEHSDDHNRCLRTEDDEYFPRMTDLAMLAEEEKKEEFESNDQRKSVSDKIFGPSVPYFKSKKDQLNLAGILNVLDGVVDTPGRILIMTTNHPELLDPALVRPGRIDKKILLGHMNFDNFISMIEHYFQTKLCNNQIERLKGAFNDETLRLTPAECEQLVSEYDDIEDMMDALCIRQH